MIKEVQSFRFICSLTFKVIVRVSVVTMLYMRTVQNRPPPILSKVVVFMTQLERNLSVIFPYAFIDKSVLFSLETIYIFFKVYILT